MNGMETVSALLERRLGLAQGSVGERLIAAAIQERMAARQIGTIASYAQVVQVEELELTCLIEGVVVHETSFFRYPESFRQFAAWALERKTKLTYGRPLRILSVPSSTGEEPYSIAMALLGVGFTTDSIKVLGVDISRTAVAAARTAVYSDFSFRDVPEHTRSQHFTKTPKGYYPNVNVRAPVLFQVGNLLDASFLAFEQPFDAIFCRNLFIYLTEDARKLAIANLSRLLASDGILYAGHAESFRFTDSKFVPFGPPQAFAFQRSGSTTAPPPSGFSKPAVVFPSLEPINISPAPLLSSLSNTAAKAPAVSPPLSAVVPTPAKKSVALLQLARESADAGRFAEADKHCQEYLLNHLPNADVYSMLGVIRLGQGKNDDAEKYFQQALYLNPKHYDSLVHMLALAEARFDAISAANYRRRASAAHKESAGP